MTDDQKEIVAELWSQGYSAGMISYVMGHKVSRNAVISHIIRKKLPPPSFKLPKGSRPVACRQYSPRERKPRTKPFTPPQTRLPAVQTVVPRPFRIGDGEEKEVASKLKPNLDLTKEELRRQITQAVLNTAKLRVE